MNNATFRYLLPAVLLLLLTCGTGRADFHVSPAGDDAHPGTKDRPFQTIGRARQTVRQQLTQGAVGKEPLTVWLAEGTYRMEQTLELTAADSGSEASPVVYRAVSGQEVRLTGGQRIAPEAFKIVGDAGVLDRLAVAARGKVFEADLKSLGVTDLGQVAPGGRRAEVFFNDRPLTLARWPNEGFVRIVDVAGDEPMKVHGITGDRSGKFIYEGDRPSRWTAEKDVWLQGYWFWDWSDQYQRVASIDTQRRTISLAPPTHNYGYRKGQRYYAVNLLAELDTPGEWYLDRTTGVLYLWPPEAIDGASVVFSVLQTPLVALRDASHVVLRDLTLETTRGSGIEIVGGQGNLVAGCTVRNTGGAGIAVRGGKNNGVAGCDLYQIGTAGISISGGDRRTLTPAGNYALNNHIHHFGRLKRTYSAAIHLGGVGNRAAHNLIHDAPHMAIGFGGNENVMELNEIYDVCRETGDVGVFYTGRDWTVRGNVIRHNFIHDVSGPGLHGAQGVYLDDCASGTIVTGNVICRTARAMLIGGGRDNRIENNIITDCKESIRFGNRGLNWMKYHVEPGGIMPTRLEAMPYKQPPWSQRYPQLLTLLEDTPGAPKGNVIRLNIIHASGPMRLAPEVIGMGTVADNPAMDEDPGFQDAAKLDFRLRDDAAVLKGLPGFQKIPFERIGLYRDEYRRRLPQK
ncbi:MAG: right-handed parallel beta-helix repeat-containing protein [Planctomycetes bacterium]|nr:right-handed parallel beta-helix repeat-containing protein [Planctomycetota bacterium]